MSRLLLYMAPASPPSRSVMMLADLIKLPLKCKQVNLLHLEQRTPQFRKLCFLNYSFFSLSLLLNPLGTVPVLQDGDFVLSDSHAIIKYLLESYGGDNREKLYPSDTRIRATVDQRMFFNAAVFFNSLAVIVLPSLLEGVKGPTSKQLEDIDKAYAVLDQYLEETRYVAADHMTIADLSVGATATAASVIHKMDRNRFARGVEWLARIEAEPVFQKVNAPGIAFTIKLMNKFWGTDQTK